MSCTCNHYRRGMHQSAVTWARMQGGLTNATGSTERMRVQHVNLGCSDLDVLARGKVVQANRSAGRGPCTQIVGSCAKAWTSPSPLMPGDLRNPTAEARVLLPFTPHLERCTEAEVVNGAVVPQAARRPTASNTAWPPGRLRVRRRRTGGSALGAQASGMPGSASALLHTAKRGEEASGHSTQGPVGPRVFPCEALVDTLRS